MPASRTLLRDGKAVPVFPKSFDVLLYLVQHPGTPASKDEILKNVWPDAFVEESSLSQSISLLRKALEERPGDNRYIVTLPGLGYQFAAPVVEEPVVAQVPAIPAPTVAPPDLTVHASRERITAVIEEPAAPLALAGFARSRWTIRAAAGLLGVVILLASAWLAYRLLRPARTLSGKRELVLADFENTTGDANFDHTLDRALEMDLEQSAYFNFLSPARVQETLTQMRHSQGDPLSPDLAREVCERNNAQAVLSGSVARFGNKYLLTLDASDCMSGDRLAESKREAGNGDAVPAAVDALAADMRRQLGESSASVRQNSAPLFPENTGSLAALKAYSEAKQLSLQGKYGEAVPLLQRAIDLDPGFAMAYADLSSAYTNLGEREQEVPPLKKAYALRDNADEQDRFGIIASYHDVVTGDLYQAILNYRTWTDVYPQNPAPWEKMADAYTQIGEPAKGIDPARHAVALLTASHGNVGVAYVILARAQMHAGQFAAARATCDEAVRKKLDGGDLHSLRMQIAYAQHDDTGLQAEVAWAAGNAGGSRVELNTALIAFAHGQVRLAEDRLQHSADAYRQQGLSDMAPFVMLAGTRMLAEEGRTDEARSQLATYAMMPGMTDPVVALAEVGDPDRAAAIVRQDLQEHPTDTLWLNVKAPQIRAAVLLAKHQPAQAIEALRPGIAFDLRAYDLLTLRGQAYLAAHMPADAEMQFRKILDNPGVDPLSYEYSLAHLGLARAYAMEGNLAGSRAEYGEFLRLWQHADSDLPVLIQAKSEYASLTPTP